MAHIDTSTSMNFSELRLDFVFVRCANIFLLPSTAARAQASKAVPLGERVGQQRKLGPLFVIRPRGVDCREAKVVNRRWCWRKRFRRILIIKMVFL